MEKRGYWNILNIFCVIAILACNVFYFQKIMDLAHRSIFLHFLIFLVETYACALFFSLFLFKIKYGPFGRLKRLEFPDSTPVANFSSTRRNRIGQFSVGNLFSKWII